MLSYITESVKKLTVSYGETKGVMPSGGDVPVDYLDMNKGATPLNNAYINCCFITTYAAILAAAVKKGACWFTFVTPAIEAPTAIENFPPINTSGYETGETETNQNSKNNSPYARPIVRVFARTPQKVRKVTDKVNQEKKKELLRQSQATLIDCPEDHEIKTGPSKFYKLDALDEFTGEFVIGMQKTVQAVKSVVKKARNVVAGKRRSGNNRRRMSPKPPMPPKKKEEVIIDEDGFQLVTGKKAARPQPAPQPVVVIVEQPAEVVKPKKAKKNKNKKNAGPSIAMILHDQKPTGECLILEEIEKKDEEEQEIEIVEPEPEIKQKETPKKATPKKKKQQKPVKKEEKEHELVERIAREERKKADDIVMDMYSLIKIVLGISVLLAIVVFYFGDIFRRSSYPETSILVEQATPLETIWAAPSVKIDYINKSFGSTNISN
ncbi:hypothetical protein GCK72_022162 [Caenorhabditis remanei]|uniref:Uncharacterized protein n=1 Tax=Caenorhabditis remanei TaxID=31234 RepID=A0A6A5FT85_CAERE|nr:hypothetical protein GCK72_022162 [Caenorhabditis remanei]KAF1745715.1 hypothetical protein GCK72_022162 [Caenorhabditis remanei]